MFAKLFASRPRVIVICTANVCRSPVAAALLRDELKARGARRLCRVLSAGTSVGGPGQLPDPRMRKLAHAVGVSLRAEFAVPLSQEMAAKSSLIVAMEQRHLDYVRTLLDDSARQPQLRLLGEWLPMGEAGGEIADPYFANADAVEQAFEQIRLASRGLAEALVSNKLRLQQ